MPPPLTEREWMAHALTELARNADPRILGSRYRAEQDENQASGGLATRKGLFRFLYMSPERV